MADIALRNYYRQIDQLIDQKHLEEALAYCKNILHHFPKDLEAYRLMGKALLERGRHGDAADVFQRVLSAMPDDFISHVGMAIVREDEGNLEAALWHMERAFEASPSNPAVQDELRRLYGRRDGIVPHRAQLTRGALARLYYKQGLYAQAETELRAGLAEQPERPDLMTLLVQVLWESGHRSEAISLGEGLLQRLPYNLEVNRVMAQAAASHNQAAEARECRQRLEELDPYEAFASEGQAAGSVQAEAIRLTEIAWSPELSDSPRPDWTNALGADLQPRNEDVLPDWVRSGTALLVDDNPTNPSVSGPTPDLPDWMRATTGMLGGAPATTPEPEAATPEATPAFEMEPEPLPPFEPAAATDDFLPDWLADMTTPSTGEAATGSDQDWLTALSEPTRAESPVTSAPDTLPDWLHGVGTDAVGSDKVGSDTGDDTPAWTPPTTPGNFDAPLSAAALGAAGAGALSNLPDAQPSPASGSLDDLPDWLQSAATAGDSDVPDWLSTAQAASTEKALEPASDLPEWLPGESPEMRNDSVLSSDTPDWLRGATGQTGILGAGSGVPFQPPAAEPPQPVAQDPADSDDDVVAANDLPAWLKAAQPADESPQTPELAVPDWLDAASADTGDLGELPDWLKASEPNVQNVTLPAATVEEPPIQEATVDVKAVEPPSAEPTRGIDLPDWLSTAAEAPTGDASFDDDAFAWLENLAARQGADPAELTTPPTDSGSPVESTNQAPSPDAAAESLPDWLKIPLDEQTTATPPASPLAEGASDDDAFAWLESLAARQGADPNELTTPTSEVELPDFLQPASAEAIERANAPVDWSEEDDAPLDTALQTDNEPDTGAMPEWIKALAPNEDAPAAKALETLPDVDPDELPDWLRPTADTTPPVEQPAATQSAATQSAASPETLSDDDAFTWLEGLAAAQGADPATLTGETGTGSLEATAPLSDDDAFAWLEGLAAAQGADPSTLTTGPSDLSAGVIAPNDAAPVELADTDIDLPDWLASAMDTAPEAQPAATPSTEPAPASASDDDAFAWLESLAARQGAEPGTLTTNEETVSEPSHADLPDWLSNVEAPSEPPVVTANSDRTATRPLTEPEAEPQGPVWLRTPLEAESVAEGEPEITLPDWLRDEIGAPMATSMLTPLEEPNRVEPSPESQSVNEPVAETGLTTPEPTAPIEAAASVPVVEEPAGPPITTSDRRTALLAGKLAERKRAREAEIQDRFDRQRAAREAAQREIEQKLANRRAGLAPEPMRSPSDLPTAPLAPIDAPVSASVSQAPEPALTRVDAPRPRWRPRTASAYADVAPDALLARSRAQLAGGQEAEAMAMYTQLIKIGQHLEAVLADLHTHIGRGKATAVAYRALGDAQMKSGALQDALASYRAALERA